MLTTWLCDCLPMDQETAQRLFAEGGVLLLLDVPERTEFGMDYNSWVVGPKFKGVKMIPPGFHFIFYSAVSRQGQAAPRTGFFHFFERREVVIKRWDPVIEDITDEGIDADTVGRMKQNLKELDRYLGPYPYESLSKWIFLTNHVSKELVSRLQPLSGKVSSVTQVCSEDGAHVQQPVAEAPPNPKAESEKEETSESSEEISSTSRGPGVQMKEILSPPYVDHKPERPAQLKDLKMKYAEDAMLRFSVIPKKKYPDGATPSQITQHNVDHSYCLEMVLSQECKNDEMALLGEIQFSFICFILGHVYDAFEHWKELVKLSCFSEEALSTHKEYFINLITVLHFQLKEIPEDFFVDIVSRNNFLVATFQYFFSSLEEASGQVDDALIKKGLKFRDNLTKKYNWDFSSEAHEFAPTVVELT